VIDLAAYFSRIGYAGAPTPTLPTLRALHALQPQAIPFENIDPMLGLPVPLDLAALQAKMVRSRRGGYCFEQNTLFRAVLEQLGFAVTGLAARVVWKTPPDAPPNPRAHMILRVDLDDGPWLADVGFGAFLFAEPLRLAPGIEQPTAMGPMRIVQHDWAHTLELKAGADWQGVYRFTLEPQMPIDFQVSNWFTSTFPGSRFRNNLMVERVTPGGRINLINRRLTRRNGAAAPDQVVLETPAHLMRVLAEDFGLDAPAEVQNLFARLPAA
jgi:N-hydroxyarylamine O-acetyltransferase